MHVHLPAYVTKFQIQCPQSMQAFGSQGTRQPWLFRAERPTDSMDSWVLGF